MSMQPGFIIASPQMRDPNFEHAVVLICEHNDSGAFGLIINRDGPVSIGAVLERMDLGEPLDGDAPTWWGGPVGPGTGFVIWRGPSDADEGWLIGDGVSVSPSADRLRRLVQEKAVFHLCLGYAGWGAGQLDEEIETGSWLYCDMDPDVLFEVPLADRYDRALALLGLTAGMVLMRPAEA